MCSIFTDNIIIISNANISARLSLQVTAEAKGTFNDSGFDFPLIYIYLRYEETFIQFGAKRQKLRSRNPLKCKNPLPH